jgi:O-antigen/teichoic acid export membrane protein
MKLSHMLGVMMGLVGLRIGGAGLNLISQLVFARVFVAEDVGLIMLCMSTAALISLFASLGYPWLAHTQLPRFQSLGLTKIWHRFHGAFLRDSAVAIILIYVLVFTATLALPLSAGTKTALLFGCLSAPAALLLRYDSSVANSIRRFTLSYAPDFLFRPLLLLSYILLIYWLGWNISVLHAMTAFVAVLYMVGLGQALFLGKQGLLPHHFLDARATFTKTLRARALPLVIVAAVATSFADIVTMIGGLLLPPADVAVLAVTIRLAALAGFVIQVTQQFVLPDLAAAITQRQSQLAQKLLLHMNILTLATIIAGLLGSIILGRFALNLFGPHYVAGQGLLVAFMIGQSIRALSGMNQQLLSIAGQQTRTASACIAALCMFFAVAIIMVNQAGLMGLGYAVIAAEITWALLLAAQAQNLTGQRGDIFWLLGHKL